MLSSGVLVLVATDVLLAMYPTVPVRASCVSAGLTGGCATTVGGRRRGALAVRVLRGFLRVGSTETGGSVVAPDRASGAADWARASDVATVKVRPSAR